MNSDAPEPVPPSSLAIATGFGVIYLSWGTTYLATSIAMKEEHMPPALFGGMRLFSAGFLLLLWQVARGEPLRISWGEAARLLLVSWFLFLTANLLVNIGQQEVPSGVAAVLVATTPLWMGLLGMLWPSGERLTRRGWLGLLVGFVGIVVTMGHHLQAGVGLLQNYRHLLLLASAVAWSLGSLVSRHSTLRIPHLSSAAYQMLFGGASQVVLGTLLGEWHDLPAQLHPRVIICFLYLLVLGSLSGFVAFNWLLGHVSAAKVGTYAYVNPVIAIFIGWCVGETEIHATLLAGIVIILSGVYLVRADHRPSQEIELEPD